jgi:hypothetical protein
VGPHFLAAGQKRIGVYMATELFRVCFGQMTDQWHELGTLEKSWVHVYTEQEKIWVSPGETVPDTEQ